MPRWRSIPLLVLVAVLFGCTPPNSPTLSQGGGSGAPKQLVIAVSSDMSTFEMTMMGDTPTRGVAFNISEPLFRRGADFKPQPLLAESYKTSNNNTVWDITLRKGVKFQNGSELDANAVKFTLDKILDPNRKPPSISKSRLDIIKSVEVSDPLNIKLILKNPDPFLRERLVAAPIVDPKYYAANPDEGYLGTHAIGTGPFKLVEWVKGDRVVLEANDGYWGGKPKLDKVIYKIIPEPSARISALRSGEADIIAGVAIDDIDLLKSEKEIKLEAVPTEYSVVVGINQSKGGPLTNQQFRQGLLAAVDVDSIVTNILKGRGTRNPSLVSKQNFGFADIAPVAFDATKAKQLIAAAGPAASTELTLMSPNGRFPKDKEVAEAIVDYLRKAGANVKLQTMPYQEFIQTKNANKLSDLWMSGWSSGSLDALDNMTWIAKSKATQWADQAVADPESDRLMQAAADATDLEQRGAALQGVQKLWQEKAYAIPLYAVTDTYAVRDRVAGWTAPTDEHPTVGKDTSVK